MVLGFYKKTILLSNQISKEKGMAILTIEKTNGGVFGNIKCFDVARSNNLVLGISVDSKPVLKENISLNINNIYNFKLHNDFDIDSKIGCVLAEVMSDDVNVLLWGSSGAKSEYKQNIINTLSEHKPQDKSNKEGIFKMDVEKNNQFQQLKEDDTIKIL